MPWSQFHSSQPHPHYPLLARTLGQQPQQEGRPCCLCDELIQEDTRTLTHSLRKCSNTFHESCFVSYDEGQKTINGPDFTSSCPSCNGNLTIEKTRSVSPRQHGSMVKKAAHRTNMLIGAYVEFQRALWQDLQLRLEGHSSPPNHADDPVLSLEETCQALTNGLRSLISQIQTSENPFKASTSPNTHVEESSDVRKLQRKLRTEEERFHLSPLAQERALIFDIHTSQGPEKQVDHLVRQLADWFTRYDAQVELRRDEGQPMQDDYSDDEYHTSIEWAGEIHGFIAAVNFGFKLDDSRTRGQEQLLENRIRERLARHLIATYVLERDSPSRVKDTIDSDRRLCGFLAEMEGEYENSLTYSSD